jgi:histidinol-phosphate aminotransferase
VVVDEAYIDFADAPSAASLLDRHANLGVLRTLSKAWALAGARIGALLAHADVIALLRRIMPPYPLPTPCIEAAMTALDPHGEALMRMHVATLVAERERLATALPRLDCVRDVLPSQANFLAVRFDDATDIYRALCAGGVVVRDIGHYPGLGGCLRLSVGTREENTRLLDALAARTVTA